MSYIKTKITAVLLCIFLLASCSVGKDTEELLGQVEQYTKETAEVSDYVYQKELGAWLAPETNYHYAEEDDRSDHIVDLWGGMYNIQQERLYFHISQATAESSGSKVMTYINLKTGEKHYLCPDPLCSHTYESGCLFIDLPSPVFDPENSRIAYSVRNSKSQNGIYKIDLTNNVIKLVHHAETADPDVYHNTYRIKFINENILYFTDTVIYKKTDENGNSIRYEEIFLKSLNLDTGAVMSLNSDFDQMINCVYISEEIMFHIDNEEKRFYATDKNANNEKTILTYDTDYYVGGMYFDTAANTIFLLITNNTDSGILYRIGQDLSCEQIPLPSDRILSFQLTDNYIYYTVYDPVEYGTSPRGGAAIDESGSKIYRTPRSNPTEGELVFDGKGELFFRDYVITGNYLYLEYYSLIEEGGFIWFRRMGSTMRVNFAEGTLKWLNLD